MIRNPSLSAVIVAAGIGVAACGSLGRRPTPSADLPLSGTYAVSICPSPCNPARAESAAVVGHLVLETTPYTTAEVEAVQRIYGGRGAFLYRSAGGEPNACFGLTRMRPGRTYVGLYAAGLTRWRRSDEAHGITVELFRSPDARYLATLRARGRELHGHGESQGGRDPTEPVAPIDSIYARRIGRVDREVCLRAAASDTFGRPR
jgi:hypothetical protein